MTIKDQLLSHYQSPHTYARAWRARTGQPVVGCVGLDVPRELIRAAGMFPVQVLPHPRAPLDAARRYCEGASGPILSSLAARLLGGAYDYLDHLIITTRPAFHVELHALLRELARTGDKPSSPSLHLLDLHHDAKASTTDFNLESLSVLHSLLESWGKRLLTEDALHLAIAEENRSRELLQQLDQLRARGRLSGSDMLILTQTAGLMDRSEHNQMLESLLKEQDRLPQLNGVPVVYSGSDTDDLDIYQAIEGAGVRIIADDQDRGLRPVLPLVEAQGDPMAALVRRYTRPAPSSWGYRTSERKSYLLDLGRERKPAAVIFHILAADHPTAWDYPALRDSLRQAGIPSLHLGGRLYRNPETEQLTQAVHTFMQQLDG